MNSALFHSARPGDIRSGRTAGGLGGGGGGNSGRVGMREAAALAKEMGFGQDFGPQAANMWKMLDDLAVTDSAAYAEMAKAGAHALRKPKGKFFTPIPGFVVKASLQRPWAPLPSAVDGGVGGGTGKVVENAAVGTKVFINLCEHEGVSPPIDQTDSPVDVTKEGRNASGLRIPMFVSRVRETTDHSDERALAVDVVFHPWVLRCSKGEPRFRDQVVALAAGWITKEHPGLVVSQRRKLLKLCTYKGGDGAKGGTPVPFPAGDASSQADPLEERTRGSGGGPAAGVGGSSGAGGGGLLDDPKSLLAAIRSSEPDGESGVGGNGDSKEGKQEVATASTVDGGPTGRGEGDGIPGALGLNAHGGYRKGGGNRNASATRDILLPGALAGLASDSGDRKRTENGLNEGRRGPLISEIVPDTSTTTARAGDGGEALRQVSDDSRAVDGCQGQEPGVERKVGKKSAPVVKKGFLSSFKVGGKAGLERAPLYPPGGSENGAEPSAYAKLMSRCKVVDTRDHSKEEMDAAMKAHAGGGAPLRPASQTPEPKPSPTPTAGRAGRKPAASAAVKKGFLGAGVGRGRIKGEEGGGRGDARGRSSKVDREYERLVALADPEMGDGTGGKPSHGGEEDPMTEQLAQLAKILGPAAPLPETPFGPGCATASSSSSSTRPSTSVAVPKASNLAADATGDTLPPSRSAKRSEGGADGGADGSCAARNKLPTSAPNQGSEEGRQAILAREAVAPVTTAPTTEMEGQPPLPAPAPTNTVSPAGVEDAEGSRSCRHTQPLSPAVSAAALKEREPVYRIEELVSRTSEDARSGSDNGGGGRKAKRAFQVTIDLPEMKESAGTKQGKQAGGTTSTRSSGTAGKRTGPSLSDVELDVSPAFLQLNVPGKYQLRLEMPCVVDEDSVTAKFSKSQAVLKVSIREK
ncbi:conserved unknown protein [Ectocarpus siliculosus]|uniref:PIH1 domain-containing protein 1 n=1 Tax=Ectocarpus siliculosus TaxID=2880 RepID=D7FKB5_ECTSI|nr:conserved unknown protein [Ectocarpus siliculosus]|eukprot:CBJ29318.1 conserved unknown protein [Ectocarpus siliculosus]